MLRIPTTAPWLCFLSQELDKRLVKGLTQTRLSSAYSQEYPVLPLLIEEKDPSSLQALGPPRTVTYFPYSSAWEVSKDQSNPVHTDEEAASSGEIN